ncbi:MAG: hypothetical protein Q8Q52_04705, partial [Acidimicrobiia bacterium]|nr:hypothetical protein [Acidimicrobiia bacterium]
MEAITLDPWREKGRQAVYAAFSAKLVGPGEGTRQLLAMDLEFCRRRRGEYPFPNTWQGDDAEA